ncbi:hypothetical protein AYX22_16755 [Arthrobacter sp. D5-1]|nr:hypothetical protein AYX22_16755 [Arthrobacter sp. D5-1]
MHEAFHTVYKIPIVQQSSISELSLGDHPRAIHTIPIQPGRSIDFYSKLSQSRDLFVCLHGAMRPGPERYPKFQRVSSMKNRVDAFLSFADPTLQHSVNQEFGIGWYTGRSGWDPIFDIANVVRQAQLHVGAERVMFLGGSAGGFAALRISTLFPGSLAFVTDPQTNVGLYHQGHRDRLFSECWPGWGQRELLEAFPERFDMGYLYTTLDPDNFVYYRQSTSDKWHSDTFARPFAEAVKSTAGSRVGRYEFVFEEGEVPGHGKITGTEFDRHFGEAMAFWDARG